MSRRKIYRLARRAYTTILFLAATLGTAFGYLQYRHQCCSEFRHLAFLAHGRQDWQFATEQFKSYLKCDPRDQQALDFFIETTYNTGDFDETRRLIQYTQTLFPYDPLPRYWTGVLLIVDKAQQDLPKAISTLQSVRDEVHNNAPQVDLFLSLANFKIGDVQRGCAHLTLYLDAPEREIEDAIRRTAELTWRQQCIDT